METIVASTSPTLIPSRVNARLTAKPTNAISSLVRRGTDARVRVASYDFVNALDFKGASLSRSSKLTLTYRCSTSDTVPVSEAPAYSEGTLVGVSVPITITEGANEGSARRR